MISFEFLFLALAAVISLRFATHPKTKLWVLSGVSAVFFSSFFTSIQAASPLLGMIFLGYAALHIVARFRRPALLGIFIFIIVFAFIWLKQYSFIAFLLPTYTTPIVTVGLSYILFRILHLLIDIAQCNKTTPPILEYLNYCLFFPTFVSGPIQRYEDFDAQLRRPLPPLTVPVLHNALGRIILGIILVMVFSAYISNMMEWMKGTRSVTIPSQAEWLKSAAIFAILSLLMLVKLYTNFSGSMHIIMGISTIAGFNLPENFNKPYLAKNFLDFWARWHITLSEWIKFYLFNPLLKLLTQYFPSPRAAHSIGAIAFFVSFMVIGLWHGNTILFVVLGILLGLGATGNKLWQQFCLRKLGKKAYQSLTQRNWYFQLSRGFTLSYIALAIMCFWFDASYIHANNIALWLQIMATSLLFMTIGITVLGSIIDAVTRQICRFNICQALPSSMPAMILSMAFLVFLVFNLIGAFGNDSPEFIYQGF